MEDIGKIRDRISKLLAMSQDMSSPNEAAIAARRARALMDKHRVSLADLKELEAVMGRTTAGKAYKCQPLWQQFLAVGVANYNDCQVRYRSAGGGRSVVEFMGYESDTVLAQQMFEFLCGQIDAMCKKWRDGAGLGGYYNARIGDTYKKGAGTTIRMRLREMTAEREKITFEGTPGTQLVLVDTKKQAVDAHFGKVKYQEAKFKSHNDLVAEYARDCGMRDGLSATIVETLK